MVVIEPLSTENLREGVFCPGIDQAGEAMYSQLEAWLSGDMLKGQVARSEDNEVYGFILYYPIEYAPVEILGEGFYVIQCIYVKSDKERIGVGRSLVEAAIQDARRYGASGIAVAAYQSSQKEGFEFMPSGFFEKLGFDPVEERGTARLLFARFREESQAPRFAPVNFHPQSGEAKLRVDVLDCSKCYSGQKSVRLLDKIQESLSVKVDVKVHALNSRGAVLDKGMSSGVFIDGRLTFFGAPVSEDDMLRALEVALEAYESRTDRYNT